MLLLDVNALIALVWPARQHHAAVFTWFTRHAAKGWATCAFTEAAFVRILCQPAVVHRVLDVNIASALLRQNLTTAGHQRLPLNFCFDAVLRHSSGGVVGHRQVTDACLLTAAMRAGGKLLSLDRGVHPLLATEEERRRHVLLLE